MTCYSLLDPGGFTEQNRQSGSNPHLLQLNVKVSLSEMLNLQTAAGRHLSSLYECVFESANITSVAKRFERSLDRKNIMKMQVIIYFCTVELHVSQQCGWSWNVLFLQLLLFFRLSAKPHDIGRSVCVFLTFTHMIIMQCRAKLQMTDISAIESLLFLSFFHHKSQTNLHHYSGNTHCLIVLFFEMSV